MNPALIQALLSLATSETLPALLSAFSRGGVSLHQVRAARANSLNANLVRDAVEAAGGVFPDEIPAPDDPVDVYAIIWPHDPRPDDKARMLYDPRDVVWLLPDGQRYQVIPRGIGVSMPAGSIRLSTFAEYAAANPA